MVLPGSRRSGVDHCARRRVDLLGEGGALTFIAAGVFATVAILALVGERIIKTLEEIRDGSVTRIRVNTPRSAP